jgi:hypothetical protein
MQCIGNRHDLAVELCWIHLPNSDEEAVRHPNVCLAPPKDDIAENKTSPRNGAASTGWTMVHDRPNPATARANNRTAARNPTHEPPT